MDSDDSDGSGRSTGSAKSCIFALLPEDLAAACTADCTPEQCDNATVRPREPPEVEPGIPGKYTRMGCLECDHSMGYRNLQEDRRRQGS
ncbi:hypothetical protein BDP81DRAFT_400162 [Colletotrichum phormii]|uniref:Uncharacterized protein n=1 Tax=Colletotrichum phormii TaxID=359342 RepID=A0AAI9ZDS5_9PEZI|nr:uncharacterized protein BDP81DRAFT_400162 [Colletotrichum phormii]KAK1622684.1 hypothetical protein BDP81DRAFT_400162 [Colletotrichum phormii]